MHTWIDFPNIGIHLENVGKNISIHGFTIAYYGIVIGIGILAGLLVAQMEAKRTHQNPETYYDLAIYGVIFGVIGARTYYVFFSWDMYKDNLISVFNTRQGGLAIYGGVIGATLTILIYAKIKKLSAPLLLDTVGMGLVTGQMIGRWGNFFNREAFGEYTNNLLAMRLPVDAVRSNEITDLMKEHMTTVKGVTSIQVSPTFLYESMWCLMVLIILLIYRYHKTFDGELFLVYLLGYGAGRVWIENLRTDQLKLPVVGLPVSQLLAGTLVVVSLALILLGHYRARLKNKSSQNQESKSE